MIKTRIALVTWRCSRLIKRLQRGCRRRSTFLTVETCHLPPREVGMPRAFSATAMPARPPAVAWTDRITGITLAAKRSASETSTSRPSAATAGALVGCPVSRP
jgi:hypothetical protein